MKLLIIYTYPNNQGYTSAIFQTIQLNLSLSHNVQIIDLYQEHFDPVLIFNDKKKRINMQFEKETALYRDKILWADHLIFIFPIWWGGMPAILKGFIDRVFSKGFAYSYKGAFPIGHLKEKTAWIVTTEDAPKWYKTFFQHDYGQVLKKQVLKMCGIKTTKHFSFSSLKHSTEKQRLHFLNRLEHASKNLK